MQRLFQKKTLRRALLALAAAEIVIAALHYPSWVDAPLSQAELEKNRKYYAEAYKRDPAGGEAPQGTSEYESRYVRIAEETAKEERITERVSEFVAQYGLQQRPVLEIGSGRGYLQDAAADYTGLDISSNVSRFYHKKFVLGSATAMPFADNTFEGGWSIWVFEHIPNPEQALVELRRVMKNKAVFYLFPRWGCDDWLAQGYAVRPYSDFDLRGKLVKASLPLRGSTPFKAAGRIPNRALRRVAAVLGPPTTLHYRKLDPNYKEYWVADSDAVNGLDRHETMLWFQTRGDECLNCSGIAGSVLQRSDPLIIRIRK